MLGALVHSADFSVVDARNVGVAVEMERKDDANVL